MHKRHNVFCDHLMTASVWPCYARPVISDRSINPIPPRREETT